MTSTSDVYIEGTENDPVVQAVTWLSGRNDELLAEARAKSALLTELRLEPVDRQSAQTDIVAFCTDAALPHLIAADHALYAPSAGAIPTRLLVRALQTHHRIITDHVRDLARANTADAARAAARAVVTTLAACLEIQRSILLPALVDLPGIDLPTMARDFDTLLSGGQLEKAGELDVREVPHGQRHPRIFGSYSRLAPGESFVLVNNHDPKPLRREFDATYPGQFEWNYLETGPAQWRIRIGRPATTAPIS